MSNNTFYFEVSPMQESKGLGSRPEPHSVPVWRTEAKWGDNWKDGEAEGKKRLRPVPVGECPIFLWLPCLGVRGGVAWTSTLLTVQFGLSQSCCSPPYSSDQLSTWKSFWGTGCNDSPFPTAVSQIEGKEIKSSIQATWINENRNLKPYSQSLN